MPALSGVTQAQTSLDVLEKDLEQVKQEHHDATSQVLTAFNTTLQNASASPEAALQLYQQAGGTLPGATKVSSRFEYETPSEKAARLAQDQANLSDLGGMLQLHCGMMRLAGEMAVTPDASGLQDEWITWLKSAAQVYPQFKGAKDVRKQKLSGSPISAYLNFYAWGQKEQGSWSLEDLPKLYLANVLDPLRKTPTADTLAAWDAYLAMRSAQAAEIQTDLTQMQADESELTSMESEKPHSHSRHGGQNGDGKGDGGDGSSGGNSQADVALPDTKMEGFKTEAEQDQEQLDKWNNDELPELQFERAADDFLSAPTEDKLAAMVAMIKAHPTHSKSDEWISRVHDLLVAFRSGKVDASALAGEGPSSPGPDANSSTNSPPPPEAPSR